MDQFEFEAPQYFPNLEETAFNIHMDGADEFFSKNTNLEFKNNTKNNLPVTPIHKSELKDIFYTPAHFSSPQPSPKEDVSHILADVTNTKTQDSSPAQHQTKPTNRMIKKARRRSWGPKQVNLTEVLRKEIAKLSTTTFEGIELNQTSLEKEHGMTTRRDVVLKTPTMELRNRTIQREAMKRKGSPLNFGGKYLTLAEKMYHFQKDTPPRFRSKLTELPPQTKLTITMAQSPNLVTKERSKPSTYLPLEERENIELKEMKSHQIKATALNRKIFLPPDNKDKPAPKPATVPEPFDLTEVKPKEPPKEEECFTFRAKPMPRSGSVSSLNSEASSTNRRRVLVEKDNEENAAEGNIYSGLNSIKHRRSINYGSFGLYERSRQKQLEKEQKLKKIIEEESKVPVFTAKPVPSFVRSAASSANTTKLSSIPESSDLKISERLLHKKLHSHEPEPVKPFKAKFPTVLVKEPFVPKKAPKPLTDIVEIHLNTERRAQEREEFDKALKAKEADIEQLKKKIEEEKMKIEKEEIKQMRKELVHKANPVPQYPAVSPKKYRLN